MCKNKMLHRNRRTYVNTIKTLIENLACVILAEWVKLMAWKGTDTEFESRSSE